MEKIAVFKNLNDEFDDIFESVRYDLYQRKDDKFALAESVKFDKIEASSLGKIRSQVNDIIKKLDDCKIVVFGKIAGIPFSVFDMAGFSIFQINELSENTLDEIYQDIVDAENTIKEKEEMMKKAIPVETDTPGVYIFDMIKVQEANPEISTKKALLPFLDSTPFLELKVFCVHLPPWIERDGRFDVKEEKCDRGILAIITRSQCEH